MVDRGPAPFSEDDPVRQRELAQYAVNKALAIIDNPQPAPTPPPQAVEKKPIDLSQLPPPTPDQRMPGQ